MRPGTSLIHEKVIDVRCYVVGKERKSAVDVIKRAVKFQQVCTLPHGKIGQGKQKNVIFIVTSAVVIRAQGNISGLIETVLSVRGEIRVIFNPFGNVVKNLHFGVKTLFPNFQSSVVV